MKINAAMNYRTLVNTIGPLASVTTIADHHERHIQKILKADVHIKGHADIILEQLLSPLCPAAVVIRRRNGYYVDPCDFGSFIP